VNDAIALKKADIGVAMGLRGSGVAKDAANIVLLDDNFASIVMGIQQGRVLFDNLKKTVAYTLSHLLPELVPIALTLIFGLPLGISSLLVLSIDLGTELAPAISLAYEKAEADVMSRPPRNSKKDRLVSPRLLTYAYLQIGVIESIAGLFAFFAVFWQHGLPPSAIYQTAKPPGYFQYTTKDDFVYNGRVYTPDEQLNILRISNGAYYLTVVLSQLGHIWMCKTRNQSVFKHGFHNVIMNVGVPFSAAIMIIIVYVPKVQTFFGAEVVPIQFWIPVVISIIVIWIYAEVRKYFTRRKPRNRIVKALSW